MSTADDMSKKPFTTDEFTRAMFGFYDIEHADGWQPGEEDALWKKIANGSEGRMVELTERDRDAIRQAIEGQATSAF